MRIYFKVKKERVFGKQLRYYLALTGKTQSQLARDLGYKRETVNSWCTGRSEPSLNKIKRIADYFHIQTSALLLNPEKLEDYTGLLGKDEL